MARDSLKITFELDREFDLDLRKASKRADRSKRRQVAVIVRRVMEGLRNNVQALNTTELLR